MRILFQVVFFLFQTAFYCGESVVSFDCHGFEIITLPVHVWYPGFSTVSVYVPDARPVKATCPGGTQEEVKVNEKSARSGVNEVLALDIKTLYRRYRSPLWTALKLVPETV